MKNKKTIPKKDPDKGLKEILAFMKRLSEFEKRSRRSNPLVR